MEEKAQGKVFSLANGTSENTLREEPFVRLNFSIKPTNQAGEDVMDNKKASTHDLDRGGWGNKLDFLFSCISLSVGLGNVWRFPYLCYKNGGGTFLFTYTLSMILCGIPLFFQEVAIGQYLGSGGMTFVGQLCPIFKGVGYASMTIVFLLDIYYCIIIAWTMFYTISIIAYLPDLPWASCDNWWNTDNCFSTLSNTTNKTFLNITKTSPVEEYFDRRVLGITDGIEDMGSIQWTLFVCLMVGWMIVYGVTRKGLHESTNVIWFSALFPYVVLFVLLGRAVTLEGAGNGLLYYVTPRWGELLSPGPWMEGATQIFFAYSIGCGALPALGSYNKFHHNSYRDAMITCIINTLTSVLAGVVTFSLLGHIALEQGTDVENVVKSGPGLVFLTYPGVVLKLPGAPFWAGTFFIMLLILGIDSQFCLVESFITGILDNWSQELRPYRTQFTAFVCCLMFLLGIPMVTQGGMYVFQLMDYYAASGISLLWVCFFQTIALSWIFGVEQLSDCIEQMMGMRPSWFWKVTWKYISPASMTVILISQCMQFRTLSYGDYNYPIWANILGLCLSLASMMWIPLYAVYYVIKGPGTLLENLRLGMKSTVKIRKIYEKEKRSSLPITDSNVGLLMPNSKQCLSEE